MSKVTVEPFFFGQEEDNVQINPEALPGAIQEETQKSNPAEEVEETQSDAVDENQEDDNDSSFDFFGKPIEDKSKDTETEEVVEKITSDKVDYKAFTDFLIETEVWKDFDGRDDIEYNSETFQALWKAQAENTAKELLSEERSQFGDSANQLIDYLKNGGTVEDFTSNYSQQLDIESIDIASESGQEQVVKEYYESIGWKPEKIKKYIEAQKDEASLKEEAEDCKAKLVEAIQSERDEMIKEQEAIAQDRKIRIESFNKQVRESIHKDDTLAEREKKELDKFIYDYKYQDKNGNKYSEFMVKMNEINQDPKKYSKFLKLIKNFDSVEDKKVTEKEVKKQTFNFLKSGGNLLEGAESKQPVKNKAAGSPPAFKFK